MLLYLLLMEERYGRPLEWGMLWYTHQPGEPRAWVGWESAAASMPVWPDWRLHVHVDVDSTLLHTTAPCTALHRCADPQLVMKRPMELACLMAVRNRLAAAIAHLELPPLSGG